MAWHVSTTKTIGLILLLEETCPRKVYQIATEVELEIMNIL